MTEAVAPRPETAVVRWPILPVLGGIAIFLVAWIGAYAIKAAAADATVPWYVLNGAMLLLATVSVGLLCRSRAAAVTAAVLALGAVLLSLLALDQLWPIVGGSGGASPSFRAYDLPLAMLGSRQEPAQLLFAGSFLPVALVSRGVAEARSGWALVAAGGVGALVALFLLVVLERALLSGFVFRSSWWMVASIGFVLVGIATGVAFLRRPPARLGGLAVAAALLVVGVVVNAPIVGWNGDELRSSDWNVAGVADRLMRDTPYMWSSLALIGAWLGMALGQRSAAPRVPRPARSEPVA